MKIDVQLDGRPEKAAARARELAELGVDGLFTFRGSARRVPPAGIRRRGGRRRPHDERRDRVAAQSDAPRAHRVRPADAQPRPLPLGRLYRSGPHIEKRYGAEWSRPAARMREIVLAFEGDLRCVEGNSRLRFEGEFTTHTLMPPTSTPDPTVRSAADLSRRARTGDDAQPPPRLQTGLLVMPFNSVRHYREARCGDREGLDRAGRHAADLAIYPQVIVGTGRTPDELAAASRGVRSRSPSTDPRPPTAPSSTSRAGGTCNPSSTPYPRSRRCTPRWRS
ncbi:LLM class flavin-dependent oxidoreductase [Rhodococcus hoagii]|nr:LLM class flavin-dependent oxidoreductase [Prescottella equi]